MIDLRCFDLTLLGQLPGLPDRADPGTQGRATPGEAGRHVQAAGPIR